MKIPFEVVVLLRNVLLVSRMLCNAEAWYNTTKEDIQMMEKIYEQLLRKMLKAPSKTDKEMLFLELGCVPLRLILRSKIVIFLQYILNQPDESLLKRVFVEQMSSPSRNDWVYLIGQDMKI